MEKQRFFAVLLTMFLTVNLIFSAGMSVKAWEEENGENGNRAKTEKTETDHEEFGMETETESEEFEMETETAFGESKAETGETETGSGFENGSEDRNVEETGPIAASEKIGTDEDEVMPEEMEVDSKAEEYQSVRVVATNQVRQEPPFTDEDQQVIKEVLGSVSETRGEGVPVIPKDASFKVDWSASTLQMGDVWGSDIQAFYFSRDESGKLVPEEGGSGSAWASKNPDGSRRVGAGDGFSGWNFFEPKPEPESELFQVSYEEQHELNYPSTSDGRFPDLISIRTWYDPSEFDENGNWARGRWNATVFVVDKEDCVFHFKEASDLRIVPEVTDNTYVLGGTDGATITCTGELNDFVNVFLDGSEVDRSNYTLAEGSTILTFTSQYLNTLSVGKHNVTLNYTYGSVDTVLTILDTGNKAGTGTNTTKNQSGNGITFAANPGAVRTGDEEKSWLWITAGFIAAGICVVTWRKKIFK